MASRDIEGATTAGHCTLPIACWPARPTPRGLHPTERGSARCPCCCRRLRAAVEGPVVPGVARQPPAARGGFNRSSNLQHPDRPDSQVIYLLEHPARYRPLACPSATPAGPGRDPGDHRLPQRRPPSSIEPSRESPGNAEATDRRARATTTVLVGDQAGLAARYASTTLVAIRPREATAMP